ncbi:MAG: hypothetical protein LBJ73_02805 [Rickettsiales bacterium]|jgi:hypothetical protein|nr:hypothetical protein [Rickettsiales bacterium]
MTCLNPNIALANRLQDEYGYKSTNKNGKPARAVPKILGNLKKILKSKDKRELLKKWENNQILILPCGKCDGCRIDQANEWATRCWCETQTSGTPLYFGNISYDEKSLPRYKSLKISDVEKFWKNIRYHYNIKEGELRTLYGGEYGPTRGRPHYHAIAWGLWDKIDDLKFYKYNKHGDELYKSDKIQKKVWKKGIVVLGKANIKTCQYVCRYTRKKAGKKDKKNKRTRWVETENSKRVREIWPEEPIQIRWIRERRKPEFQQTSRRPAIGKDYWEQNKETIKKKSRNYDKRGRWNANKTNTKILQKIMGKRKLGRILQYNLE